MIMPAPTIAKDNINRENNLTFNPKNPLIFIVHLITLSGDHKITVSGYQPYIQNK
jgi:hypothetical protein